MNLYEFEGKELFKKFGIPVPESVLVKNLNDAPPIPFPFVVKAQALSGGRGKAGGIKICKDEAEYKKNASDILGMKIKEHNVHGLLCEEIVDADKELYLSITLQGVDKPTLIFSDSGGIDIEQVAENTPEKITKIDIDPFLKLKDYEYRKIATAASDIVSVTELRGLVEKVQDAFFSMNALLIEINPIGVVDGKLVAMDSKFVLDDNASVTTDLIDELNQFREGLPNMEVQEKEKTTLQYVPFEDGDVALISDGAGPAILTLDLITDEGGKVSSFCELGGVTDIECIRRALYLTLNSGIKLKSLIIVLFGGFNKMTDMAEGIISYKKDYGIKVPLVTVMCGTLQEEGRKMMADAGLETVDEVTTAIKKSVQNAINQSVKTNKEEES